MPLYRIRSSRAMTYDLDAFYPTKKLTSKFKRGKTNGLGLIIFNRGSTVPVLYRRLRSARVLLTTILSSVRPFSLPAVLWPSRQLILVSVTGVGSELTQRLRGCVCRCARRSEAMEYWRFDRPSGITEYDW
jgi:hypothetical protein